MKKRVLSILLCFCMAISLLPMSALAADEITINGNIVCANGIPIIIKENGGITSIYDASGTLLSGETDVKDKWIAGGWQDGVHEGNTSVTVESGTLNKNLYGGSFSGTVTGNTSIAINGGTVAYVYGGNENSGTVDGNTNIELNGGTVRYTVYGGGYNGITMTGNIKITAKPQATVFWIYGGNNRGGTVSANVEITSEAAGIYGIYAGGAGWNSSNTALTGAATINVTGGSVGSIYASGGGNTTGDPSSSDNQSSTVSGNVAINIKGGTVESINTEESNNSIFTGAITVNADGGQLLYGCYLGRAGSIQAVKNANVTLKDQTSPSLKVQFLSPIAESLNIVVDGKFVDLEMLSDVLKDTTGATALTYQNCGSQAGTWAAYGNSGTVSTTGTNPYTNFKHINENTFDTVTLKDCYLDYDGNTYYGQSSAISTMATTLILDGGSLRCFLLNTSLPAMQFENQPTILSSTTSTTEVLNFASVSGTAKIAVLDIDGITVNDPFSGITDNGVTIASAPQGTSSSTFSYQGLDTTKYMLASAERDSKQDWYVLPLSACRCSLDGAMLEIRIGAITEGASSATMTLKDILEGSAERSQDCPILGHQGQTVQSTYAVVSDGTTASGAVITNKNQLTVTSAGQVKIHVTDTLNEKTNEYDSIVMFAKEPAQTAYTFNKSDSAGVVLKISGDSLSTDKDKTQVYQAPGTIGNIGEGNWSSSFVDGVLAVTIQPSYLKTLSAGTYNDFILFYKMTGGEGQGAFHFAVTITNKTIPTGAPTLSKTSMTYGEKLSTITLSGNMTGVAGAFTWSNAEITPGAGICDAVWTFTPSETETYETVSGTITIPVSKATPTGTPSYAAITSAGYTLKDAALTSGTITPEGTIQWNDDVSTIVLANTSYVWTFTPTDSTNYNILTGTVTPYVVENSSSAGNGGGGAASGTTVPVSSGDGSVRAAVTVSSGTATIGMTDAQIKEIASATATTSIMKIDVSSLKVDAVVIPAKVVTAANGTSGSVGLAVVLPTGTVTLDKEALGTIAGKGDVKINVEPVTSTALSSTQKAALGSQVETALVVDVNVFVNGTQTSTFGDGKITVSVPYTPKSGENTESITVWFIKDDGTIEPKNGVYNAATGCVEFTTEHLSQYLIVSFPFRDVAGDAWYYGSVAYAYNNGLFAGTGAATFSPETSMTRQMIWMVLARMDGKAPADMDAARTWAVENGISDGSNPTSSITREQMAAILFRYAQYKGYDTRQGGMAIREFADYESISEYALTALGWSVNAGLLQGSDNNLMPTGSATRAQVATILQRFCQNVAK